jgi:hypothetical protein
MAPRKPKKDPKEAADAAEARSKNKTTAKSTKAAAPKASKAVAAAKENPDTDKEMKALFLHHLVGAKGDGGITALKAALNTANANLRNAYRSAKADGLLKVDFDDAFAIQQADGEKKKKAAIMRSLTIAKWLGCDLGQQLDMFAEPSRVPAAERAFSEGESASMLGKPLKCDYHESTEQYRQFCAGFNSHQETLQAGFKKLEPKEGEAGYPTEKGYPKQPSNVVAMTRAEAEAQKATH